MKRLIDGNALASLFRTRRAMDGNPTAQDAFETAMWDAASAQEITLNDLRDEIYQDALEHGLWEDTEKTALAWSKEEPPSEQERYYTLFRRTQAAKLVFFEGDELLSAAEEENWDNLQEELADVVIQAFSTAGYLGIDIDAAVKRKMEINKNRSWKHEGEKHDQD
jgi:NTP pyrophosphatase (non-canonical NTP hydrolase)